jgi:hypothetical protein
VGLQAATDEEGHEQRLIFDSASGRYLTTDVQPGNYWLIAEAQGFESQRREVQIDPAARRATAKGAELRGARQSATPGNLTSDASSPGNPPNGSRVDPRLARIASPGSDWPETHASKADK